MFSLVQIVWFSVKVLLGIGVIYGLYVVASYGFGDKSPLDYIKSKVYDFFKSYLFKIVWFVVKVLLVIGVIYGLYFILF